MKCCICGNEIEGYGNNPYPVCDKEDQTSRCCDDCNNLVIIARIVQSKYPENDKSKVVVGTNLALLYSTKSKNPVTNLLHYGKVLAGTVTSVSKNNTVTGDWGNFPVDLNNDNYCIIEDN